MAANLLLVCHPLVIHVLANGISPHLFSHLIHAMLHISMILTEDFYLSTGVSSGRVFGTCLIERGVRCLYTNPSYAMRGQINLQCDVDEMPRNPGFTP